MNTTAAAINAAQPQVSLRPRVECYCVGNARAMGLAQGNALQAKIVRARQTLSSLEAFRLEQHCLVPYPLFLRMAERRASKALTIALRQAAPDSLARLEGIAQGSGLPLRSLCILNALEALISAVAGRTVPAAGACSALAVRGPAADGGEPVVARNFDYMPAIQPLFVMRESAPRNGFRSLEFAVAPQAGSIDGVNEQGLCITQNYAFVTDPARPGPLVSMIVGEALAACSTVAEAAEHIARRPHWGAALLMLSDASGDIAVMELSNTRAALRRPPEGTNRLAVTNVCVCPEMRAVQIREGDVFSRRVPRALQGKPVLEWHADRARRIEELAAARPTFGPEELRAIMADHGPNGVPDGTSPCVHTDYWRTTATLQWFPSRRRVRVSYSSACAADYAEFGL